MTYLVSTPCLTGILPPVKLNVFNGLGVPRDTLGVTPGTCWRYRGTSTPPRGEAAEGSRMLPTQIFHPKLR